MIGTFLWLFAALAHCLQPIIILHHHLWSGGIFFLLQIFIVVVCCQSLGENDDWWKINWRWQTPQHICDVQLNWLAVGKTKLAVSRIKANNFNGHWPSNRLASEAEIKYVLRKLMQWNYVCVLYKYVYAWYQSL